MARESARATGPFEQRFLVGEVEPTAGGVMAWAALTRPEPSREETAALIGLMFRRGMRQEDATKLRTLGYPVP